MNKSLIGALLIGVASLIFFVFVMPAYDVLGQVQDAHADRVQLLADAAQAQNNLIKLNKEFKDNQDEISKILVALPQGRQLDYITASIHIAAADSGMELSSLVVTDPTLLEGNTYVTIPVSLELGGTYTQFKAFTEKLEKSLRLYDITKMDISSTDGSGLANSLSITLQLVTYSLK